MDDTMICERCGIWKRVEEFPTAVMVGFSVPICTDCERPRSTGLGDLVQREYGGESVDPVKGSALMGMRDQR